MKDIRYQKTPKRRSQGSKPGPGSGVKGKVKRLDMRILKERKTGGDGWMSEILRHRLPDVKNLPARKEKPLRQRKLEETF